MTPLELFKHVSVLIDATEQLRSDKNNKQALKDYNDAYNTLKNEKCRIEDIVAKSGRTLEQMQKENKDLEHLIKSTGAEAI